MGTMMRDGRESEAQSATNQARLQKIVLSWDYYRLLSLAKVSKQAFDQQFSPNPLSSIPVWIELW